MDLKSYFDVKETNLNHTRAQRLRHTRTNTLNAKLVNWFLPYLFVCRLCDADCSFVVFIHLFIYVF